MWKFGKKKREKQADGQPSAKGGQDLPPEVQKVCSRIYQRQVVDESGNIVNEYMMAVTVVQQADEIHENFKASSLKIMEGWGPQGSQNWVRGVIKALEGHNPRMATDMSTAFLHGRVKKSLVLVKDGVSGSTVEEDLGNMVDDDPNRPWFHEIKIMNLK